MHGAAMRLERTLPVEQENERRKGRKPTAHIRCAGFRQQYQSFSDMRGGGRLPTRRGGNRAETGGTLLQKLC